MALEGTLRDFALRDTFQLLGDRKKTGRLPLSREGEQVAVSPVDRFRLQADRSQGEWALHQYRLTSGRFLTPLQVLIDTGFLPARRLRDPWRHPLRCQLRGLAYRLEGSRPLPSSPRERHSNESPPLLARERERRGRRGVSPRSASPR